MAESLEAKVVYPDPKPCGGCGTKPGKTHEPGCDWERCPLCGGQAIVCPCIYEVTLGEGAYDTLEFDYPKIYVGGPTEEMCEQFDAHIEANGGRMIYDGYYAGTKLAVEQGWYVRWGKKRPGRPNGGPWIECTSAHPDATPDLNKAAARGRWDREQRRRVLR